ncbi:murein biosynthesis integral membrane protein MurJ, partial [Akkermansiaceae bacterium]|nr:murein biosynthesis integral membrane protein MurJ [Akkermansiaceae bacterium]
GGEVQAVGETVSLESIILDGLTRGGELEISSSSSEQEKKLAYQEAKEAIFKDENWLVSDEGLLRVPLPSGHDFAVFTGGVSGEGVVKVYRNDPGAFALTVKLSKITFIYLLCMALVAHLGGVLTTLKKFAAPAFSPVLLNIVFLIGLTGFARFTEAKGELLAWCVAIAGFVQLGVLWWTCRRARLPVALQKPVFNSDIKRLFILMGPGVIAAGIQQINLLIGGIIASFQQGAISTLYYSDRVYQLPLGMIGIAFGMVLLPEITRLLSGGKESEAAGTMRTAIELAMIITVPAAIAFMAIPREIMSLLFERGAFTSEDSLRCGQALAAFAIGLPGYVLIKVLQPGYFARENTRSPMVMAGITVVVNIIVSLSLFPFIGLVGIALATSVAAWVNVLLLWRGLKGFVSLQTENWKRLGGVLVASLVMAAGLMAAKEAMSSWLAGGFTVRLVSTGLLISFGATVYVFGVLFFKVTSVSALKNAFKK